MKFRSLCFLVGVSLLVGSSNAIIIRHDVGPGRYEVRPGEFPSVFFLERQGSRKVCVATVIHQQWALTAAHCAHETLLADTVANGRRFAVEVANQSREIDRLIVHPDYDLESDTDVDLALVRFREPASLPRPVALNLDRDEMGQVVSLLGWGYFGLGTTGRQYDDGTLRLAQNRISDAVTRLRIKFDDPRLRAGNSGISEDVLDLEGMPGLGDSGGPAFLQSELGYRLAGIAVGEIKGEDFSEETQGKYGSIAIYERVSLHIDWIETVIEDSVPFDS